MAVYSTSVRAKALIASGAGPGAPPTQEIDLVLSEATESLILDDETKSLFPVGGAGTVADIKIDLKAIRVAEDKTYRFQAFLSPGNVRPLTNETVHISFQKRRADGVEVINKDSGTAADINIVDEPNGIFDLLIDTLESAPLIPGIKYEGDCFIEDANGERIHYGQLILPVEASAVIF